MTKVISVVEFAQRVLGKDVVNDILEFDPELEIEEISVDTRVPILDFYFKYRSLEMHLKLEGFSSAFRVSSLALSASCIFTVSVWIIQYLIRNVQFLEQVKQILF